MNRTCHPVHPRQGCTAHTFSRFAPRFADRFHVMAFTRRGHGESDYPESGYDPDTLAEDLRQFLDALHSDRVILAGHSMGCVELSRFASLQPERVHYCFLQQGERVFEEMRGFLLDGKSFKFA